MDPPPLPPNSTTIASSCTNPSTLHLNYPDSDDSSPRSGNTFNEALPPVPGAKLRLMCSYGGHIIPRPHDRTLCYVGGQTRIVAMDRHSSLSCFFSRISRTLLNGRPFTLKYQLPNEDLDSLVSVITDEDLDNLIDEYDRITASSSAFSPARIRLFIFFNKPEAAASMGSLFDDAKSETWFVDTLNGAAGLLLPRNFSDSATMDSSLVNLDNDHALEAHLDDEEGVGKDNKQAMSAVPQQDALATTLDSPELDPSYSYSFASTANLPPIQVRVQDHKVGVEEQFAHLSFAQVVLKQDDGHGLVVSAGLPPQPAAVATAETMSSMHPAGGSSENLSRILSDDERSGQSVPVSFRKPPLAPLPIQPVQQRAGGYCNLPSPDSVASDTSSIASTSSLSKPTFYQDQAHVVPKENIAPASSDVNADVSISSSHSKVQQLQDSGYTLPPQGDQQRTQQFIHASMHFVHHPASTPMPISSYYPVYAPQSQQLPYQPIDQQQYPPYVMPITQTQPYVSMHPKMVETTSVVASSRPLIPPNPASTAVAASAAYMDSHQQIYPGRTVATSGKPEMGAGVCGAAPTTLVQIPTNPHEQRYVGYPQIQHASHSIAIAPAATTATYCYDQYADAAHEHAYYTHQHQTSAIFTPQYQTMTPAEAVALADASKQLPTGNTMQQIGKSLAL